MSPTSLSFTAQQGETGTATQILTINNTGHGTLIWTASNSATWLTLSPASGTGAGVVTANVLAGALPPGSYSETITLSASGATTVTIPVSFTVTAAPVPSAIGMTPASLSFTAQQGGSNPPAQTLAISNTGNSALRWAVSHDAAWLGHTPNTGAGAGTVTISVTTGTLTAGTHSGQVTLWPTGATTTPVTIPVSFTVTAAPVPPTIGMTPTRLSFTAQQGGSNPPAQTLAVSNTGSGTLSWAVSHDAAWLGHTPNTGAGAGTVTISATTGTLTAGTHSGQVTLWPRGATTTPVTIPVSFTVTAAPVPPTIGASPTSLAFTAIQGGSNPAAQTLSISNTSGDTLNWSVSHDATWLGHTPNTGTGTGTVTISVLTGSLTVGAHSGRVTVWPRGATTTPVTIPVSFTVTAAPVPPAIGASPTNLAFTAIQGGSNPAVQTLSIRNSGGGTLNWSASETTGWLTLTAGTGTGTGTMTVQATTGALAVGSHTGTVILSGGTGVTPIAIPVSFTVTAAPVPPAIGASPTSLAFTAIQGGSNPAAQTLSISNTSGDTLNWSVSHDATWLGHTPNTGTGTGTVTINVLTGSLTVGAHSGRVTVWPRGATTTPVTIPVSFTVTAAPVPPAIGASPTSLSFTVEQGSGNPAAQTLSITNRGGGTLTWSVTGNSSWIAPSPASGTGNGGTTISVTTGFLAAGTYNGTIALSATGVSSVTVPVTFTVTPRGGIATTPVNLSPSSLNYTATQDAANPVNQNISLTNTSGTLNWTVSDDASWLIVSPASGTGSRTLSTSVNTAGLTAGTYHGTLTVSAAGISPKTVAVTLTVNASATSSVTLTWNANTESDLAGYKIYRATTSGGYGTPITTLQGNVTTFIASGLQLGTTYYFVITAYDSAGNESPLSNEVNKSIY